MNDLQTNNARNIYRRSMNDPQTNNVENIFGRQMNDHQTKLFLFGSKFTIIPANITYHQLNSHTKYKFKIRNSIYTFTKFSDDEVVKRFGIDRAQEMGDQENCSSLQNNLNINKNL